MFERCTKRVELYVYGTWLFSFWSQFYNHIILCCCWGKQQTVASAISVNRDLWKLHLFIIMWESLLWAERRNSVLFSNCCLILIACAYFLSDDCTICYTFWDKNIIEIEHTNFNQAAFFVNRVVKLIATIQPCPIKISIHTHTHQAPPPTTHTLTHTRTLTNTPGRT